MFHRLFAAALAGLLVAAVAAAALPPSAAGASGAVFTMSNASGKNKVMAWSRAANGSLTFAGSKATGGRGWGGQLNNQGGLAIGGDWLYAVNAGSNTVSVFRRNGTSLTRTDVEPSGGAKPISVAVDGTLVYVLNAGGNGGVRGFRRDANGQLTPIAGAARPLSGSNVKPVQIGFTRDGAYVLVTERATDRITRYRVTPTGAIDAPQSTSSEGPEPFGFDVAPDGTLVVSEAGNHVQDASSVSSYRFNASGAPVVVSSAVPTTETAACWVTITPNGDFAYETNTPDHSISGFALGANGSVSMLNANGVTAATGAGSFPIDLDTSSDSGFLYVLTAGTDRILVFAIGANGALAARPGVGGLPNNANGLVAR
ncbi:MAG TPA: beta-propeller fold lactonase family protein [Candidatus Limnocylindrales bacterium]|nr:beta-propeller fold lactonase family protein [Candidatus Limnocylindrales bacterium]